MVVVGSCELEESIWSLLASAAAVDSTVYSTGLAFLSLEAMSAPPLIGTAWLYIRLTPSTPAVPTCCCSKGSAPYWSNLPFLSFDIRALWRSGERQSVRMSKDETGGFRAVWQSVKP